MLDALNRTTGCLQQLTWIILAAACRTSSSPFLLFLLARFSASSSLQPASACIACSSSTSSHASHSARVAAPTDRPGCTGRGEASGLSLAAAAAGATRSAPIILHSAGTKVHSCVRHSHCTHCRLNGSMSARIISHFVQWTLCGVFCGVPLVPPVRVWVPSCQSGIQVLRVQVGAIAATESSATRRRVRMCFCTAHVQVQVQGTLCC